MTTFPIQRQSSTCLFLVMAPQLFFVGFFLQIFRFFAISVLYNDATRSHKIFGKAKPLPDHLRTTTQILFYIECKREEHNILLALLSFLSSLKQNYLPVVVSFWFFEQEFDCFDVLDVEHLCTNTNECWKR